LQDWTGAFAFVALGRIVHLVIKDADNPDNRKLICDKTNIGSINPLIFG
jgi:hypothetical protein